MVKQEEITTEAAGGGRGFMDMLGHGEDHGNLLCPSPSFYFSSGVVPATTTSAAPAAASPTCASYLDLAPPYHHMLSFTGQDGYYYHGDGFFDFQYYGGGGHAIPVAVPQKSSPTTECSSSISSMSSSPTATAVSAISSSEPQASKKKGSRGGDQRKPAPAAAKNKRPRVRKERLGERIVALQQLVSPFGKSDTASVLHEALGYIRFLHDQVKVLSSPCMQRLPASPHASVQESAAGTVMEPPRPSDLRSRGLCLVPVSYTEHVASNGCNGNGADIWSVAAGMAMATAAAENKAAAAAVLPGGHPGHFA